MAPEFQRTSGLADVMRENQTTTLIGFSIVGVLFLSQSFGNGAKDRASYYFFPAALKSHLKSEATARIESLDRWTPLVVVGFSTFHRVTQRAARFHRVNATTFIFFPAMGLALVSSALAGSPNAMMRPPSRALPRISPALQDPSASLSFSPERQQRVAMIFGRGGIEAQKEA